jgi:DNA-binding transcriptional regulator GbsR (MarR family)
MVMLSHEKLEFIEEVGLSLAHQGLPRMAGRLLGALLIADPPEQSAEELARTLKASRGSISTMTRMLEVPGLIERVSKPGDRRVYFRNKPDAWYQSAKTRVAQLATMRTLAEKGLSLVQGSDADVRRGLEDMHDFYLFWESELPKVLDRWKRERV